MDPRSIAKSWLPAQVFESLFGAKDEPVILELDLDRGILSAVPTNPLAALRAVNSTTVGTVVAALRAAAHDGRVRGLILHVGTAPIQATQADELGLAIAEFSTHKPSAAFSASYGELSSGLLAYRLACHAREIWVQPSGGVVLSGVHAEITLLRGGLDKLGVEPQLGQRHEYKSAADQFMAHEVTPANREMIQGIVDSLANDAVAVIAERRRVPAEAVRDAMAAGPLTATNAKERGLIDRIGYRDEVYAALRDEWVPDDQHAGLKFVGRYHHLGARNLVDQVASRRRPVVALVNIAGGIVWGRGQAGGVPQRQAASDVVCEHLRAVGRDESVKAVVLRVDSPGGSYIASDSIRREVLQLRATGRPIVASMGAVAASGGYFVAMGANRIVANPSTLTGSIGVYGGKFVTAGLFNKLGIVREGVDSGPMASMLAADDPFTEAEWQILNAWLDQVYADFTTKAAADRGMPLDVLEPLARGRVWTGSDARSKGLVDELGGLERAIQDACSLAGLDREKALVKAVPIVPFLERFRPAESSESVSGTALPQLPTPEGLLARAAAELGLPAPGVLALPWTLRLG